MVAVVGCGGNGPAPKVGARVNGSDLVGYSGTSGGSSGPHLHFQVMGDCPTAYCQSIGIAFAQTEKPACGNVEKSDNRGH
jgi:murein DD-endopeptidase MepM/ murein hydrolase activator NlpD